MPAVGVIGVIMMMILPVPAFLLDLALVTSIALSLTILIVSLYVKEVLDFSAFPSVLLFADAVPPGAQRRLDALDSPARRRGRVGGGPRDRSVRPVRRRRQLRRSG